MHGAGPGAEAGSARRWWPRAAAVVLVLLTVGALWWAAEPSHRAEGVSRHLATRYSIPFADGDQASRYHVVADHLGTVARPGVVFFFDGDYPDRGSSRFATARRDRSVQDLARTANQHGMLFVFLDTPAQPSPGQDLTWWKDAARHGTYARALIRHVLRQYGVDDRRIWLEGWSGGAEFASGELLAHGTDWWRGGGATLCGGGGVLGTVAQRASGRLASLPVTWHEGEQDLPDGGWSVSVSAEQRAQHLPGTVADPGGKDTVGDLSDEDQWSGYGAGVQGFDAYRRAGYRNLEFISLPQTGHTDYDLAASLDADLDRG